MSAVASGSTCQLGSTRDSAWHRRLWGIVFTGFSEDGFLNIDPDLCGLKLTNLPRGVVSSCIDGCPGGEIPPKSKNRSLEKIVYTSRFSTGKPNSCNNHIYHVLVSMRRNCSISCLAAPGVAQAFSVHLDPPRDNYDVQSTWLCALPNLASTFYIGRNLQDVAGPLNA